MREILRYCAEMPLRQVANGTVLLEQGQKTGRAYVLAEGRIEVLRGDVQVAVCDEPGALIGEMSVLLDQPHTATARALGDAKVHLIEDADAFFRANPPVLWLVGRLLASRLNAATGYLADLKQQFADHGNHLSMVGEVLESLLYVPYREVEPGSDRAPGAS
jgi:CRP-like cAMP-binding protein